jgi:histidyl-tRNA synthetase
LDLSLARGLNYYTGAIFEVKALDFQIGSICGGGRYDDLTGIFGLKDTSGVGISYGAERIYDVLEELNLFPEGIGSPVRAIFLNFGPEEEKYALKALQNLRNAGIVAELFPDKAKIGKQMNYANARLIPFVVMAGENEMNENYFTVKNMKSCEQTKVMFDNLVDYLA